MATRDEYVKVGLMGATREALEGWAKIAGIKFNKNTSDIALAEAVNEYGQSCDETTEWPALGVECNNWCNAIQSAINALPPEEAAAPVTTSETVEEEPTPEEIINACKTKKAVVEKAKELGSTLKIVMTWKLADMKEKVLASLIPAEEPAAAPSRTPADPNAPEPSAAAVGRAKATARTTADAAKKKKGSQPKVDGEPFRQGTTAWLIWDTFRQAKKALSLAELKEAYLKAFNEQKEITSSNPEGRIPAVMSHMKRDEMILPGKVDGTWIFNPNYKAE